MGLAASQARLLTITARKADCEFQSMALSHQKLALARDMERVSTEYQNALNQTKLVYDYFGSADKQMDLTYGLFMSPSVYNDYVPKLVTDPTNRIILNSQYAAAARAAGIPAEGLAGTPSSDVRDNFIKALEGQGLITPSVRDAILKVNYNNAIGLGGSELGATVAIDELTYDELLERIKASCSGTSSYGLTFGTNTYTAGNAKKDKQTSYEYVYKDNKDISNGGTSLVNISLNDLLYGEDAITLHLKSVAGELTPVMATAQIQTELADDSSPEAPSFLSWMYDQFASVLGGLSANDTALQYAYNAVWDLVHPNSNLQHMAYGLNSLRDNNHPPSGFGNNDTIAAKDLDEYTQYSSDRNHTNIKRYQLRPNNLYPKDVMDQVGTYLGGGWNEYENVGKKAVDYLGFVYAARNKGSSDDGEKQVATSINLNNLAKAFLTSYVMFMEGIGDTAYEWSKGRVEECTLYNPKRDKDFKFQVAGETEINDGGSALYAQFYDAMFNKICMNGWTENAKIDDKEYMQELIKGGMAFVTTMSDDGFYYQNNYATDKTILEVTDDEAIARALAKYNTEKARIEYKEDRIDLKMKNLDTEISSLSTEYDTTKQLIGKTIEKSFKRYEA